MMSPIICESEPEDELLLVQPVVIKMVMDNISDNLINRFLWIDMMVPLTCNVLGINSAKVWENLREGKI